MHYTEHIISASFKAKGEHPSRAGETIILPLVVTVLYESELRGLPTVQQQLLVESVSDLNIQVRQRLNELNEKAQLYLTISDLSELKNTTLDEIVERYTELADTATAPA